MEQLFLMPGQERCERFKDANGAPRVHYSYCSMRGAFFDCESRSLEEAQRLCEDWLVGQDRCYRNRISEFLIASVNKEKPLLPCW